MDPAKTVEDRVKAIFDLVLGSGYLVANRDRLCDLGFDSLDVVDIVERIESEFEIDVEADDADDWVRVEDAIRYVRSQLLVAFTQTDVDSIVARAKELGAGPGLAFKMGQFQLSNYSEPHNSYVLAQVIVGAWDEKWDLIYATQALIEFLSKENAS